MSEKNEWKLVPIEPTKAMVIEGVNAGLENKDEPYFIYRAMINASPAAPGVSTVEDERQEFEAWAKRKKMPLARIGQQYDDFWVDHAWNGWQARAALDAPATDDAQTAAARDVLAERQRQISVEGWEPERDDTYRHGELASAAASYAQCAGLQGEGATTENAFKEPFAENWPWSEAWWKPSAEPRRNLVKAGALILAEIERLDRAAQRKGDA